MYWSFAAEVARRMLAPSPLQGGGQSLTAINIGYNSCSVSGGVKTHDDDHSGGRRPRDTSSSYGLPLLAVGSITAVVCYTNRDQLASIAKRFFRVVRVHGGMSVYLRPANVTCVMTHAPKRRVMFIPGWTCRSATVEHAILSSSNPQTQVPTVPNHAANDAADSDDYGAWRHPSKCAELHRADAVYFHEIDETWCVVREASAYRLVALKGHHLHRLHDLNDIRSENAAAANVVVVNHLLGKKTR